MPRKSTFTVETVPLEDRIGTAVAGHYLLQLVESRPLADPTNPEDVLDVTRMVMNHCDLGPDEIVPYVPQIRGLMSLLREDVQNL